MPPPALRNNPRREILATDGVRELADGPRWRRAGWIGPLRPKRDPLARGQENGHEKTYGIRLASPIRRPPLPPRGAAGHEQSHRVSRAPPPRHGREGAAGHERPTPWGDSPTVAKTTAAGATPTWVAATTMTHGDEERGVLLAHATFRCVRAPRATFARVASALPGPRGNDCQPRLSRNYSSSAAANAAARTTQ